MYFFKKKWGIQLIFGPGLDILKFASRSGNNEEPDDVARNQFFHPSAMSGHHNKGRRGNAFRHPRAGKR
jgi:hypothetical protein